MNAALNATAAGLMLTGYGFVRAKRIAAHKACMLSATGMSVLFLACYLYYHAQAGSTRFQGQGAVRTVYFAVLLSHTILAAIVPFLVVITLVLAFRGKLEKHRRLARWTLPIWLYVSVTGVVVYWMLYHLKV